MPNEPALNTFLRERGIEPTDSKKKNMKLARQFFTTYKQSQSKGKKKK